MFVGRGYINLKFSLKINTCCIYLGCCWVICPYKWNFNFQVPFLWQWISARFPLSTPLSDPSLTSLGPLVHWTYWFFTGHPPLFFFSFPHSFSQNLDFLVCHNSHSLGNIPISFWHAVPAPSPPPTWWPFLLPPLGWNSVVREQYTAVPVGQFVTKISLEHLILTISLAAWNDDSTLLSAKNSDSPSLSLR